jgi:hypothetical protein
MPPLRQKYWLVCLGKPVPEVGEGAGIIHQNDFLHQLRRGPVQYRVDRPAHQQQAFVNTCRSSVVDPA